MTSGIIPGNKPKLRDQIYFLYRDFQCGIRTADNWKLILYNVSGVQTAQLFNCNTDPDELRNLAGNRSNAARLIELKGLLAKEMKSYGDNLDISKPNWGAVKSSK